MFFQSRIARHSAIEVACTGVTLFPIVPTPDNCDSFLDHAAFSGDGASSRFGISFLGGPLTGPPGGSILITPKDA